MVTGDGNQQRMYGELAPWWPLLSARDEYAEEAAAYSEALRNANTPVHTVLELGAGGGNNAWHMKRFFDMTLVDLSEGMLAHSRKANPECEHHQGDMRTFRLGRTFDAVFIHDAIDHMTTLEDLQLALNTAFAHVRPGGVTLLAPDDTRETFVPGTDCGGTDGADRGMRFLQWSYDPDPTDSLVTVDYAFLLRLPDGNSRVEKDRHIYGLFSHQQWLDTIAAAGFHGVRVIPLQHSELRQDRYQMFLATKSE